MSIPQNWEILFYTWNDWNIKIEVFFQDETIWLSQKQIAMLFDVWIPAISKHLKNIFESWELDEKVVVSILEIPTKHWAIPWKTQNVETKFYNLDAIIAVWYRVNSKKATQFRIWATKILKEFIIKGFVLDDERLKNWSKFGKDYFQELLEKVRSIRASERRIYQKITDIFAECAIDYDPNSQITKDFYATVQNKFHYAITGKTAAEIIYEKADAKKEYMWLTTWKNSPNGRILKSDVIIAKNYLQEKEIKKLERTVSSYFDYIENQIEKRQEEQRPFKMDELAESINKFLEFNDFKVLDWKWQISHKKAIEKASKEYDEFNKYQKIESDFDKEIKKLKK